MPIDLTKVPHAIKEAVKTRSLVPLVGAGVSRQADQNFPSWEFLLRDMAKVALDRDDISQPEFEDIQSLLDKGNFLMAAQAIKFRLPYDTYIGFLQQKFDVDTEPAHIHQALFKLNAPLILTTNYDTLLEDAYAKTTGHHLHTWTGRNAAQVTNYLHRASSSNKPHLFKCHGSIDDPDTIVLTNQDYSELIHSQQGYRMVLTAIFITRVVVMIGFSGDDPELKLLLEEIREAFHRQGEPDFILLRKGSLNRTEKGRWRDDLGIEVIEYEASEGDPELCEFIEYLATFAPS